MPMLPDVWRRYALVIVVIGVVSVVYGALVALAQTDFKLFYYLRWIVPTMSRGDGSRGYGCDRPSRIVAYTTSATSLVLGLSAGPVLAVLDGPLAG
ncbi:hypothetical protein SMICM304S_11985 [Streptomyces microflavus]